MLQKHPKLAWSIKKFGADGVKNWKGFYYVAYNLYKGFIKTDDFNSELVKNACLINGDAAEIDMPDLLEYLNKNNLNKVILLNPKSLESQAEALIEKGIGVVVWTDTIKGNSHYQCLQFSPPLSNAPYRFDFTVSKEEVLEQGECHSVAIKKLQLNVFKNVDNSQDDHIGIRIDLIMNPNIDVKENNVNLPVSSAVLESAIDTCLAKIAGEIEVLQSGSGYFH